MASAGIRKQGNLSELFGVRRRMRQATSTRRRPGVTLRIDDYAPPTGNIYTNRRTEIYQRSGAHRGRPGCCKTKEKRNYGVCVNSIVFMAFRRGNQKVGGMHGWTKRGKGELGWAGLGFYL